MSLLTLARHGQACFLEANYDRLSALGERQSRMLGEYWATRSDRFDQVYRGPAERHRQTTEIIAGAFRAADGLLPEARVLSEFDEFDGLGVVRYCAPPLMERHPHVHRLVAAFEAAAHGPARKAAGDELFREVARRWVAGEVSSPAIESWAEFCARVRHGVEQIRNECAGAARVLVITSAGPTAVAASLALQVPPRETLELALEARNTAYTELVLEGDGLTLRTFNTHPHLGDQALWTHI